MTRGPSPAHVQLHEVSMQSAPPQAPATGARRGGHMQIPNRYHEAKISAGFTLMQRSIVDVIERLTLGWRRETVVISAAEIAHRFGTRPTGAYYRAWSELVREGVVTLVDAGGGQTPHTIAINFDFAHGWGRFSVSEERLAATWDIVPISFAPSATKGAPTSPSDTLSLAGETSPPPTGRPALPLEGEGTGSNSLADGELDQRKDRKDRKDTSTTTPARAKEAQELDLRHQIPEVYRPSFDALLDRVAAGGASVASWVCECAAMVSAMAGHHGITGEQLGRTINDFLGKVPEGETPGLRRFRNYASGVVNETRDAAAGSGKTPGRDRAERYWAIIRYAGLHHKTTERSIHHAVEQLQHEGKIRRPAQFVAFLDTLDFKLLRDARTDRYAVEHIAAKLVAFTGDAE